MSLLLARFGPDARARRWLLVGLKRTSLKHAPRTAFGRRREVCPRAVCRRVTCPVRCARCGNGAMVEPARHRQTKEAGTDMFEPKATAPHLDSTDLNLLLPASGPAGWRSRANGPFGLVPVPPECAAAWRSAKCPAWSSAKMGLGDHAETP
jgi:hypothetical protein